MRTRRLKMPIIVAGVIAVATLTNSMHAWAKGADMTLEVKKEITEVVQKYVTGYLNAESRLVGEAFHSDTILYSVDEGKLDATPMSAWIKNLDERKANGDIRVADYRLESIDVTDKTATAKVILKFAKAQFTDYLSLLYIGGKWIIIGKIYSVKQL